ncbi:MAG: AAA family ATPase [Fimbriiglobus sp.]
MLTGLTGTGKTQTLAAVRAIFAAPWIDRRTVKPNRLIGCAVTDAAAEALKHDTGIEAVSVGKLVSALTPTPWPQVLRAVRKMTFDSPAHLIAYVNGLRQPRLRLDRRATVLVEDASAMNTKNLYALTRVIARSGAKLVLVGDPVRSSFAGHSRVLDLVTTRYPDRVAKLECIQRQFSRWAAQAVKAVAAGDARWAVAAYRKNGLLTVAADPAKAREAAIQLFAGNGGIQNPRSHLLLATTGAEVQWLNMLTQEVRKAAGVVTGPGARAYGRTPDEQVRIHTGDRVMFQRGHTFQEGKRLIEERFVAAFADPLRRHLAKHLPEWLRTFVEPTGVTHVRKQEFGTILAVSPAFKRAVVELDTGKRAVVKLSTFRGLGLGYAANVFQSHAIAAPHVYTLMGGRFTNRQAGYLGLSRASIKSHLIVTAKGVADLMADPERAMDRGADEVSRQMAWESGPKAADEKRQDKAQRNDRLAEVTPSEPERGKNTDGHLNPHYNADPNPHIKPDLDHEQEHDFDFDR